MITRCAQICTNGTRRKLGLTKLWMICSLLISSCISASLPPPNTSRLTATNVWANIDVSEEAMENANLTLLSLNKTTNDQQGCFFKDSPLDSKTKKSKTSQDKTADCCRSLDRNCAFIELSIQDLNTKWKLGMNKGPTWWEWGGPGWSSAAWQSMLPGKASRPSSAHRCWAFGSAVSLMPRTAAPASGGEPECGCLALPSSPAVSAGQGNQVKKLNKYKVMLVVQKRQNEKHL